VRINAKTDATFLCSRAVLLDAASHHLIESGVSFDLSIGSLEAEEILTNLRLLRDQIVTAWSERGVVLSRDEQVALHAEIKQTCEFLTDLTRHP
jgi:hypothetical protein